MLVSGTVSWACVASIRSWWVDIECLHGCKAVTLVRGASGRLMSWCIPAHGLTGGGRSTCVVSNAVVTLTFLIDCHYVAVIGQFEIFGVTYIAEPRCCAVVLVITPTQTAVLLLLFFHGDLLLTVIITLNKTVHVALITTGYGHIVNLSDRCKNWDIYIVIYLTCNLTQNIRLWLMVWLSDYAVYMLLIQKISEYSSEFHLTVDNNVTLQVIQMAGLFSRL